MIWFILALIFVIAGLGLTIFMPTVTMSTGASEYNAQGYRTGKKITRTVKTRWIGIVVLSLGLGTLGLNTFTLVPTRSVGVETAFGKPVGSLTNGFHWVRPWADIHDYDAAVQTMKLSGDKDDDGEPIVVRLANGSTAIADLTVQWQLDQNANITQLHMDYREFNKIRDNVVRRQLSAAANEAMEKYDPLISLSKGENGGESLSQLADKVKAALQDALPDGIIVRSVLMPKIVFADEVQAKINQYLAALAETKIAEQRQKTAEAQKKANDLLAAGTSTSQAVLYQNCLDMVERLSRDSKPLPAAFSCGNPPVTTVQANK
jgi:regulator of protease activity HflC (stomatin/prohibitin superfamily)